MSRRIMVGVIALGLFAVPAFASAQSASITGFVRTEVQAPVRGAMVQIEALGVSTLTNDQGRYTLTIPAGQVQGQVETIRVTSIGHRTTELTITLTPGSHRADVTMPEQAVALDEVVVTGTAGRLERRAQAAVVASVDAARIAEVAPVTSVAQILQSRVPGVMIRQGSGSIGTSQSIRIRGQASISLSNEPLVFIDGVRADARTTQFYTLGGQQGSRLNDIRIEEIERIEVVKGPAAATLYGADASAGVIQIFTKRGRAEGGFTQSVTAEYGWAEPAFTPLANWGTCLQSHIDQGRPLCQGATPGTIISDNPLVRYNAFENGLKRGITWTLRGGGERYGTFLSVGADMEDGTLPSNTYGRTSGRANFDFMPSEELRLDFGFGLTRSRTRLPHNDNNIYGYLGGGFLGNPLSVGFTPNDGWYAGNRHVDAISSIENYNTTYRIQPTFRMNYSPRPWFSNRLTFGADMTRSEMRSFFPRNDEGWYDALTLNSGQIGQAREARDALTLEYMGNMTWNVTDWLVTDYSFGTQLQSRKTDLTNATGIGLVTNETRGVNAAAESTGGQSFSEERSIGGFGQIQFSLWDRLYIQTAGRIDQHSAFGADTDPFFSPRVGVSYVISDEAFFHQRISPDWIGDMRIRAAYGTTGRSPSSGARADYNTAAYAITDSDVGVGVIPRNPGNPDLKPERGTELELGFEAGVVRDRVSMEVNYFRKVTKDLIRGFPLPASLGFSQNPQFNVGEVLNRGFEIATSARLLTRRNFAWEARVSLNTLENLVVDLGDSPESQTLKEGFPLSGHWQYRVQQFDVANDVAIVSDTMQFIGNGQNLPGREASLSTTLTLLQSFSIYAQFDYRGDVYVFNSTDQFRERQNGTGERWVRRDEILTDEQRLHRFGPFVTEDGRSLARGQVSEAYVEKGDFVKLREITASYRFPNTFAERYLRASSGSISFAARNLKTWTDYLGLDPETGQFLTVPQDRRYTARLNLNF